MLQHFIIQCLLFVKWSLTGGEKQFKRGHGRLQEVIWLETFGILENWSLATGGGLQEVIATGGWKAIFFLISTKIGF